MERLAQHRSDIDVGGGSPIRRGQALSGRGLPPIDVAALTLGPGSRDSPTAYSLDRRDPQSSKRQCPSSRNRFPNVWSGGSWTRAHPAYKTSRPT
ncbi:hypothetical protein PsYK624_140470 [Phanerochaete sordida]|uniref:Uncharacterized protein n=1 Tax=Phanerochaete sordida TaxID=48140 RepID=A0A9P3LJY4_9APHY|nr:hypothetical protein PsYK624_140470 [Phanerochaete sordida]